MAIGELLVAEGEHMTSLLEWISSSLFRPSFGGVRLGKSHPYRIGVPRRIDLKSSRIKAAPVPQLNGPGTDVDLICGPYER